LPRHLPPVEVARAPVVRCHRCWSACVNKSERSLATPYASLLLVVVVLVFPAGQESVGPVGRVHVAADHVPARVDSERLREGCTGIVEGCEIPMAIHKEAVGPAGRVLVDADRPSRRVYVPARRGGAARHVEGDELAVALEQIRSAAPGRIGVETYDGLSTGSRSVVHACRRGELRELVALIDEPVHGTHRVRVVIAAENGSVGPDPRRDGIRVAWEIDATELATPGHQVAMCVHRG